MLAMANSILGSLPGSNTGNTTSNPQSGGQSSSLGAAQNPQSLVGSNSINNQTTGTTIQLPPASLTTASIQVPSIKTTHHKISTVALVPAALLVIAAFVLCIYIYLTSKRSKENLLVKH
jgi:hypothetical protein